MTTTVRMLQQMSGTRNGVPWPEVGEFLDVSEDEAVSLTSGQTPIAVEQKRPEPPADLPVTGADATEPAAQETAQEPPAGETLAAGGPAASAAAKAKARTAPARPRTAAKR